MEFWEGGKRIRWMYRCMTIKCGSITPMKFNITPEFFRGVILNFRGVISWTSFFWNGFFGLFIWKIGPLMLRNKMDVFHEHGAKKDMLRA